MQVQEVSNEGLKREYKIKIACDIVEQAMAQRLEQIGKTANVQGFRPGKAPLSIIKQRYGATVRSEVLDDTVSDSAQKALQERNLRPAAQPQIELISFAEGQDLEFKLALEVLPEITLKDFGAIKLERPVVQVEASKVDEIITRAVKQSQQPVLVTENRAAKMGDVAVIDFDGSVDGERQPGMKSEGHQLELGSHSFIDTFEDQIVGMKAGDSKDITVKFPDNYHAAQLSGKQAVFAVKLNEIRSAPDVELNDEAAKQLGFDTMDALRERVTKDLAADYEKGSFAIVKRKLMDDLAKMYDFAVPAGMVQGEFASIWQQIQQAKAQNRLPAEDAAKSDEALKTEYNLIAERRVRLGLLLADVGRLQKITVTNPEIRDAMMNEARRFPGQEQAVINYYTQTEGALEQLRAPVLEEKTVKYILTQVKVTDKTVTVEELLKLQEDEEEA